MFRKQHNSSLTMKEMRFTSLAVLDDEELVRLVIEGKPEAFQVLVDRYDLLVRSIAARHLARDPMALEDVCQETFLKALVRIESLRNPEKFKSWLCAIANNQALDTIRRDKQVVSWGCGMSDEDENVGWDIVDMDDNPADAHFRDEVVGLMRDILDDIPQLYREPISLRYEEDLDYQQISDILGKPLGTIKSLIHRGKEIMREELTRRAGSPDAAMVLAG